MGFQPPPRNEFRASLKGDRGPVVVNDKNAQCDPEDDGVGAVLIPRSEHRRGNHRGEDRHRLSDEQALVRHNGESHVVELVNLSQGGAMVAGDFAPHIWDKVDLVLGEGGEVECAVTWLRDGKIGLEFAHETQVECDLETLDDLLRDVIRNSFPDVELRPREPAPKREDDPDQNRAALRHPMIWNGVLHHDFAWQEVRLRNISSTGALVECQSEATAGANVFLDLKEAGRMAARVSWVRGNQAGLAFAEPFDVSSLSKTAPILAKKKAKAHFAPYGRDCDQSPWAPEWKRLSIDELGADLGG